MNGFNEWFHFDSKMVSSGVSAAGSSGYASFKKLGRGETTTTAAALTATVAAAAATTCPHGSVLQQQHQHQHQGDSRSICYVQTYLLQVPCLGLAAAAQGF